MENKALMLLSAVMGALFALIFGLIMKLTFAQALFSGILFAMLLFAALKISERRSNRKYAEEEEKLGSEVLFKLNCNYRRDSKLRNGYIYVCEDALHVISMEKKTGERHVIPYDTIESVRDVSPAQIDILLKADTVFSVTAPKVLELSYAINERIESGD